MTLYHVSPKYLGKAPILTPRIPESRAEAEESVTPRICVCPNVEGCYLAKYTHPDIDVIRGSIPAMHLYAVETDDSVPARKVPDARRTGERWLLEPTKFRYVGKLRAFKPDVRSPKMFHRDLRADVRWILGYSGLTDKLVAGAGE